MQNLFIRSKFLIPLSEKLGIEKRIEDGFVLTENKKIIKVGEYTPEIGSQIIQNYRETLRIIGSDKTENYTVEDIVQINGVTIPGFVKAHGHDHESPIIGIAKDVPLTEWLDNAVNYFTNFLSERAEILEEKLQKSPHLVTYLKARLDDLSFGITACLTHHCNFNKYFIKEIAEANSLACTKMVLAIGSQDRNYDERILDIPHSVAISRLDEAFETYQDQENFWVIPGPDQLFSNGPDLLKALKKWANEHPPNLIHIHSSEEPETTKWFTETYGMTPVQYADSIGFLDERTILAHQVNSTDEDLAILKRSKAQIVHNPLANTILGSGMPPILRMLDLEIPMAISTDGSGSADNQNIINAARVASQYQKAFNKNPRALPAQKALEMITVEPAKMLGLNCGSLETGKDADIIVIDLEKPNLIPTRLNTVVENIIWAATGAEIRFVISNGHLTINNYSFTYLNANKILEDVQVLAKEFDVYMQEVAPHRGTGIQ